jgi:hypothetical protein
MQYKDLILFKDIINRNDFTYISETNQINTVISVIRLFNTEFTGSRVIDKTFRKYIDSLTSFYFSIKGEMVPDIRIGYSICTSELERLINLRPNSDRLSIGRGRLRKMVGTFLSGLNKFTNGLYVLFEPRFIGLSKVTVGQVARFILDKEIGLGKKYIFNSYGGNSPANKFKVLTKKEIVGVVRVLSNKSEIRTLKNGWTCYGSGRTTVRLLGQKRKFARDRIYYVFTMDEHTQRKGPYNRTLDSISRSSAQFLATS